MAIDSMYIKIIKLLKFYAIYLKADKIGKYLKNNRLTKLT